MKINKKTIASAALLLMLAMPAAQNTYGQGGGADGFLFSNNGGSRDNGEGDVTWEGGFTASGTDGNTPVGSGLLVLAASGACYAALKVRRSAKGQREQGNGQTEI